MYTFKTLTQYLKQNLDQVASITELNRHLNEHEQKLLTTLFSQAGIITASDVLDNFAEEIAKELDNHDFELIEVDAEQAQHVQQYINQYAREDILFYNDDVFEEDYAKPLNNQNILDELIYEATKLPEK